MTTRPITFENPPVVERVISLQFAPLGVTSAEFGAVWASLLRDWLPNVSEQPPISTQIEHFGMPSGASEEPRFLLGPPPLRLWFCSADKRDLLQVQDTRLVQNWRKEPREADYVRFSELLPRYQRLAEDWFSALDREPTINQCEITYVNHIDASSNGHGHPENFFSFLGKMPDDWPLRRESTQIEWIFRIDRDDEPVGRLRAKIQPAVANQQPIWVFELTARSLPDGEGIVGAVKTCQSLHQHVVEYFIRLTTPEMHHKWGRIT